MANSEDVLVAIKELSSSVKTLKEMLYAKNGFEGDIPETKRLIGELKTLMTDSFKEHDTRISRNSRLLFTIIGILSASGISFGIGQWLV